MSKLWPSPYYIILKKESLLFVFFVYNTLLKILGIKAYPNLQKVTVYIYILKTIYEYIFINMLYVHD